MSALIAIFVFTKGKVWKIPWLLVLITSVGIEGRRGEIAEKVADMGP